MSLAAAIGRPGVPLLWEMLRAEKSNVTRRDALLAAAILAGGPAEDERLYGWLSQQKAIKEERTMAALAIALGPPRMRAIPNFWSRSLGPTKSPVEILAIAVRLAAARVPDSAIGAPTLLSDEPGLAGATAFAGLPVRNAIWNRRWNLRDPVAHADLFWRGALLHAARLETDNRPVASQLLTRARAIANLPGQEYAAARRAAALLQARRGDVRVVGARPERELLEVLVSRPEAARKLRKWLGPTPQPRDDRPQRLAVAYVLSRDPAEVVADRQQWSRDPRVSSHVAVALAWRLLGEESPKIEDVGMGETGSGGVPEWFFVRWAAGLPADAMRCEDLALTAVAELAAAGRLPRTAARQALEEALWRWDSHPGRGLYDAERVYVRDLLLVGSDEGGQYVPAIRTEDRYRPTGIGHARKFFEIAVAVYEHFSQPRLPLPPQYRLR
ncbi:MAG: hypothetical protein NXI31_17195 [bacterium]|nr:hypothetical protein [bacterium]